MRTFVYSVADRRFTILNFHWVQNFIRAEKLEQIPSMIEIGKGEGMLTMNQSLYRLAKRGIITTEMAFKRSADPEGLQHLMEKGM